MIEIQQEQLLTMREACRAVPGRNGKGLAISTLWRWAQHGRRGYRLETVLIGGQRYTSREAIQRFVAALNGHKCHAAYRDTDDQKPAAEAVERRLLAEGFRIG